MGKTIKTSSPSHHRFYRWYGYRSQSWLVYGIVLPTVMFLFMFHDDRWIHISSFNLHPGTSATRRGRGRLVYLDQHQTWKKKHLGISCGYNRILPPYIYMYKYIKIHVYIYYIILYYIYKNITVTVTAYNQPNPIIGTSNP